MMRRILFLFLAMAPALPAAIHAADVRVELKNVAAMAVSVPLGIDHGVTNEIRSLDRKMEDLLRIGIPAKTSW
jgi:hypothetical protein